MGKSYPEVSLAGAVEADDAAGGVEDDDQGVDRVKHRGDEVAFDGECGLDALARAGDAVHLADRVFSSRRSMTWRPSTERALALVGVSRAGGRRERRGRRWHAVGGGQRCAGVEAEGEVSEDDALGGELGSLRASRIS